MKHPRATREKLVEELKERLGVSSLTGFASVFTGAILEDLRHEIINGVDTAAAPPPKVILIAKKPAWKRYGGTKPMEESSQPHLGES